MNGIFLYAELSGIVLKSGNLRLMTPAVVEMTMDLSPDARVTIGDAIANAGEPGIIPFGTHAGDDLIAEAAHALINLDLAIQPTTIAMTVYSDSRSRARRPEAMFVEGSNGTIKRALELMADSFIDEGLNLFMRGYLDEYGLRVDKVTIDLFTDPFIIEAIE